MPETKPKYPDVRVQISGEDGNIYAIGGRVGKALGRAGVPRREINELYQSLSSAKSYDEALQVVMDWVEVD
jgi:hypothetical protein